MKKNLRLLICLSVLTALFASRFAFTEEAGRFTVQVATSASEEAATEQVAALKKRGLSAFYSVFQKSENLTVYRINVGHLPTRGAALKFKKTLIAKYDVSADAYVRLAEDASGPAENLPKVVFKVLSENLPTPTPAPTPTPTPAPVVNPLPDQTTEPFSLAPSAPAQPLASPATVCPPPAASASTGPINPQASAPAEKSRSNFSLTVSALIDATNYSLTLPTGYGTTGLPNTLTSTPLVAPGFAVLPTLKLSSFIDLQTGLMLFQRTFNVNYNNGLVAEPGTESYTALEVPLLAYFNLTRHLALGLGGYVIATPAGAITQSTFSGPPMPDSNLSGSDWGFTGAVDYTVALVTLLDMNLSARYNYGNGNFAAASSNPVQVYTDYQFLAGIRCHFGQ